MKSRNKRVGWVLASAVAAAMLTVGGSESFAQYRVGDDGRARDANNRIGSGGYNAGGQTSPNMVNGNQLVTGNVTGGREFRGFVPYTDPGAFRGNVAGGGVDRFVANSAGVPTGVFNNNNAQNVTPFYGDSRGAPPPTGFVQQAPGSTGYVPGLPQVRTGGDIRMGNPFDSLQVNQPRAGQLVMPGPVDPTSQAQTVITASPLYGVRQWKFGDAASEQFLQDYTDVYANSRRGALLDSVTLNQMRSELAGDTLNANNGTLATQTGDLNADRAQNSQMNAGALNNDISNQPGGMNPATGGDGFNQPFNRGNDAGGNGGGGTSNGAQPLNDGLNNDALSSDIRGPGQTMRNRVLTNSPSAARASRQYAQLQERLQQYQQGRNQMADIQANQRFQAERRAAAQGEQQNPANPAMPTGQINPQQPNAGAPGTAQPGGTPQQPGMQQPGMQPGMQPGGTAGGTAGGIPGMPQPGQIPGQQPMDPNAPGTGMPGGVPGGPGGTAGTGTDPGTGTGAGTGATGSATPTLPGAAPATPQPGDPTANPNVNNRERPLQITSFTKDMKDSRVTTLMKEAEDLMKQGKYTTALERYDVVDQVSPNDPLVTLGRATAELGASYYTRADSHLRQAFTQDPALLMGQYDLRTFLGDERLRVLVSDLKDLATRNKSDVRPVFLLSYIAYNTGSERNAAGYLDLAEKRSAGKDPFFKLLRDHWALPQDVAPVEGEMNK